MATQTLKRRWRLEGAAPPTPVLTNRIFNFNASAEPGQGLSVQGHFPADATFFIKSEVQSVPVPVFPFTVQGITLQAKNSAILRIPDSSVLDYERYEVYVVINGQRYPSIFVNRVSIWFADATEVTAGGRMRVQGRNLLLTPGLTTVWFTPKGGGAAVAATLVEANCTNYYLEFDVLGIAPGTYELAVSNGYGGNERIALADKTITVLPAVAADPLGIKNYVPYYSKYDFVGNVYDIRSDERLGSNGRHPGDGTDARAKIQAALDLASKAVINGVRGGLVKISGNGTHRYLIDGGVTVPEYAGLWWEGGQTYTSGSSPNQANAIGMSGIRAVLRNINHVNESNEDTPSPHQNFGAFGCTEPLIIGGNLDLGEGLRMEFRNCHRPAVIHLKIQQGITPHIDARQGPVLMLDCTDILVYGRNESLIEYKVGAWSIWHCNGLVQGLRMRWNYEEGNFERIVNHVLAVDGCFELAVRLCNFDRKDAWQFKDMRTPKKRGPGEPYMATNDGENGISETPGNADTSIVGQATGWSSVSMSDTSKVFTNTVVGKTLHIISGEGAGQFRTIVALAKGNSSQVVLDRPFDVTPSAAGANPSRYSITTWTSYQVAFESNTFTDGKRGILFYYNNCFDCVVVNNHLLRNGMLDFTTRSTRDGGLDQNGPQRFQIMYMLEVSGNIVDGRGDETQGAGILFHQVNYVQNQSYGTSFFGGRIHGNKIYNDDPNQPIIIDADFWSGIYCGVQFQSNGNNFIDNVERPALVGIIISENEVSGSRMMANTVTGNLNVLLLNNRHHNCTDVFYRDTLSGNGNAGRNILELNTRALAA